jgi:hypothetical protein
VLKRYSVSLSSPLNTLIPESGAETATAPRIRQKEQLQRLMVLNPSDSSTVKATAPQWHCAETLFAIRSPYVNLC